MKATKRLRKALNEFIEQERLDEADKRQLLVILAREFLAKTHAELQIRDEEGLRVGQLLPNDQIVELEKARAIIHALEFPEKESLDEIVGRVLR